jgi:branched-chain amino acid transport system substrate-binding protein
VSHKMRLAGIGLAAVLVAGSAGCTSSASKSVSNPPADTASTAGLTGSTIGLVAIQDQSGLADDQFAGAQAAVSAVNASGGIKGHPLKLTRCSTNNNPAATQQCARNSVADSSVVANVSSVTGFSGSSSPILLAANMANVGPQATTISDFSAVNSFPAAVGALDSVAQALIMMQYKNATHESIAYLQNPAAAALPGLVTKLAGGGLTVNSVAIPGTVTDMTSYARALQGQKPDWIGLALQTYQIPPLLTTLSQLQITTPITLSSTQNSIKLSKQFPTIPMYQPSLYNLDSAGYKTFAADMAKYQPTVDVNDHSTVTGWLGVEMFAQVASKLDTVTKDSVYQAFKSTTSLDTQGLTVPLNFSQRSTLAGGKFPSLINTNMYPYQVVDGQLKSLNNNQPVQTFK